MANKTEKEEKDQLEAPETLAFCTPSISGSDGLRSDLNTGVTVDSTSSSGISTNRPDLTRKSCSPSVNRCSGCRRKVGLTGFRCRCGEMFCSDHRYSDRHDCCYDYKAAGREAIARENPVVRAAKILKV